MYEQTTFLKTLKSLYKLKKDKKEIITTQESLNFKKMFENGVCQLTDNKYSKMIRFSDISYQLAHDDEKQRIFSLYCMLLNSFDSTVGFQFLFINFKTEETGSSLDNIERDDSFYQQKVDYFEFVAKQKAKGSNGLIRNKYLVFTVTEEKYATASRRLDGIEIQIKEMFKNLGVQSRSIEGKERLSIINYVLNSGDETYISLDNVTEKEIFDKGLSKSYIAPKFINYQYKPDVVELSNKYLSTYYFNIIATEISDRVLVDMLNMEREMMIAMHIAPLEQQKAIKMMKAKNTDLNSIKIEEQKKSLQRGYDMDILPTDLAPNIEDTKAVLKELQKDNEKYFWVTFTISLYEKDEENLNDTIEQLKQIVAKYNCELLTLTYQQEKALLSALPFGNNINEKELERGLTTSAIAGFVPFITQELFQETNNPVYYGLNALSNNVIQVSRKNLKNPNGLFLGTPGGGKSFAAKREMLDTFLRTLDDILINDPEGEYSDFVRLLKGEVIRISINSKEYINPLDISMEYGEGDNPVVFKSDFILTMMNVIAGGKEGITPRQLTLTDKATRIIYRKYLETQKKEDLPILEDLYNEFRRIEKEDNDKESKELADALELYVHGSLNVFNHHTNINPKNRLICFNIQELGNNLKDLGMLILQDHVWNRVTKNRSLNKKTWYYMDEFHKLLAEEQTSNYSVEFWKRFRKWGGVPSGITQNVKDLMSSPKIETILENSDFIYLLSQSTGDRRVLQEKLDISDYQATFITNADKGHGLIIYDGFVLPFKDVFEKNNSLYPVMTTDPEEIAYYKKLGLRT